MAHTFCATLRHHKHIPVLMFLFLTGLLLRASWLMEIQRTPDFQIPLLYQVDMGFIDNSALDYAQALREFFHLPDIELKFERQIVWRHHAGDPLLRPPGYTFFLSLLYFLFGDNQLLVRIVQMSLGMAGGLLGFLAGRKLAGVRAGVIAAGALWLYWPLILYESVLHEPVLVVFVSLLFLNSALQWLKTTGLKQAAKTGFLCGIFTVCASQIILFLPVMLLWFLWFGCKRFRNLRRSLSHAGLAGLFFFLPLLPVSCLNYYESGMFVLNSHGHGITLYIGNQPGAEGLLMPGKPLAEEFLGLQDSGLRADEIADLIQDWTAWSHFSQKAAIRTILSAPGDFIKRSFRRTFLFWAPFEISQNVLEYCDRLFSSSLSKIPGNFGIVLPCLMLGVFYFLLLLLRRFRKERTAEDWQEYRTFAGLCLICLLIVVWYLPITVLWVSAHFRIPLLPSFFLLAAFGMTSFLADIKGAQWRRAALNGLGASVFILPAFLFHWNYDQDIQTWLYHHVKVYENQGNSEAAAALALFASEKAPDHAFVQKTAGDLLLDSGRKEEAMIHYAKARKCTQGVIDQTELLAQMGIIQRDSGNNDAAELLFQEVLQHNPEHSTALHFLGNIAYEKGAYETAETLLKKAVALETTQGNTFFLLGLTQRAQGKTEEAERAFRQGLFFDPDNLWLQLELADVLTLLGHKEEACALYQKVLENNPGNERAQNALSAP